MIEIINYINYITHAVRKFDIALEKGHETMQETFFKGLPNVFGNSLTRVA